MQQSLIPLGRLTDGRKDGRKQLLRHLLEAMDADRSDEESVTFLRPPSSDPALRLLVAKCHPDPGRPVTSSAESLGSQLAARQ